MTDPGSLLVLSLLLLAERPSTAQMQVRTCTDYGCHADLQAKAVVHDPVGKGMCSPCHTQSLPNVHEFQLSYPKETLCRACHLLSTRNYVHQPVRDGQCTGCHDPHQSEFHSLLRADPSRDLCLTCHADDPFMKKQHLHGPVAMGACILCHEAHSSWKPKLLVAKGNELCARCHEEKIREDQQARHVHAPVNGDCVKCHDPHGSDFPEQLPNEGRQLCLTCHDDIRDLLDHSEIVHGAVTKGQECRNCHVGHSSSLPALLKKSLLDTCLECHNEEIPLPDGRKIENMATLLKENPNYHGPVRQADCSACHNPHASSHFDLLTEAYPKLFYAPADRENYRLCFRCHRPELISSPQGSKVTEFRNGDLNLHYVHVSRPSKGRTCRACHAVHASKSPAHISESVPYGNWKYPIRFDSTDHGGKCGPACHEARRYDRTAEVPASRPADAAQPTE